MGPTVADAADSFTPPPPGPGEIRRAIAPGSRLCHSPRTWLDAAHGEFTAQGWQHRRIVNAMRVARCLARHMNWQTRTTRPGHGNVAAAAHVSTDTVARVIRCLGDAGLLGLVSPGTTSRFRSFLHRTEPNHAAVYVCTTKRRSPAAPSPQVSPQTADPTRFRRSDLRDNTPRTRARPHREQDRAPRGPVSRRPSVPCGPRPAGHLTAWDTSPQTRSDALDAAQAMRVACGWARALSPAHVRHLARAFWAAGWTIRDVLTAIDHAPTGRAHHHSDRAHDPGRLIRWRLSLWSGADGPVASPSQRAAAAESARAAAQRDRRAAAAAMSAQRVDPTSYADRIRAQHGWARSRGITT